ncbi:galectin-3b [Takifugu flavidus]|uniref:galectin-3b n=1 Tax=Takifugu flavidus TaxID=433684 RepID=UPI0025443DC6|nr:galectin-3b [Takifugu flavidus]
MFQNNNSDGMDLKDALDGWPNSNNNPAGGSGQWPGQPNAPVWPGKPPANPTWPGNPSGGGPVWPSPTGPTGPTGPTAPTGPVWPGPAAGPGPTTGHLAVPYQETLPSGVFDKLLITITGTIKMNANKITVDMATSRSDLAFHFNPRFNECGKKVIVRNSFIGQKWGPEERQLDSPFPFVEGKPFEIKILCTNNEFRVAVNNAHLLAYQYRIRDLRSIKYIRIHNDLSLSGVKFETLQ